MCDCTKHFDSDAVCTCKCDHKTDNVFAMKVQEAQAAVQNLPEEHKNMIANVGAVVVIGGVIFLAAKYGSRAGMKPTMNQLHVVAESVAYNAQVSYDNVQATIHNGDIILDAIKKAQPAIDAINAVQGR